jgi:hypothetical protein
MKKLSQWLSTWKVDNGEVLDDEKSSVRLSEWGNSMVIE